MAPTRRQFIGKTSGTLLGTAVASAASGQGVKEGLQPAAGKKAARLKVPANYYQQFDADFDRAVPAEGYGGWKKAQIELAREHTAVVVMHAWDCGSREQYPGWHRAVEYIPRSYQICRTVFPRLLAAVRAARLPVFHVVGGGNCHKQYPGYKRAVALAGPEPGPWPRIETDAALEQLRRFRAEHVFPGAHNQADIQRGFQALDFPAAARPQDAEGIAENGHQLFALCQQAKVNHLIYAGFAINWCLLLSPGGMADMDKRGLMCSVFRQAVTAVENQQTARTELCKEIALWRVAVAFGFVFDVDDFLAAL